MSLSIVGSFEQAPTSIADVVNLDGGAAENPISYGCLEEKGWVANQICCGEHLQVCFGMSW